MKTKIWQCFLRYIYHISSMNEALCRSHTNSRINTWSSDGRSWGDGDGCVWNRGNGIKCSRDSVWFHLHLIYCCPAEHYMSLKSPWNLNRQFLLFTDSLILQITVFEITLVCKRISLPWTLSAEDIDQKLCGVTNPPPWSCHMIIWPSSRHMISECDSADALQLKKLFSNWIKCFLFP